MGEKDIFVSVGAVANEAQDAFVRAVEDRLRAEGLNPHTVGRNTFGVDAPLKTITELLDTCAGAVVIALERTFYQSGVEKRGGKKERMLGETKVTTPWNQIEAALAYSRGQPLLVIVEDGLRTEGLLEKGNDWYVQSLSPEPASLTTSEFNGILASWKRRVIEPPKNRTITVDPSQLSLVELFGALKPGAIWTCVVAAFAIIAASFTLGVTVGRYFPTAPIVKTACLGEGAGCVGNYDAVFDCDHREAAAQALCSPLGRTARIISEPSNVGGGKCGYSVIRVECS